MVGLEYRENAYSMDDWPLDAKQKVTELEGVIESLQNRKTPKTKRRVVIFFLCIVFCIGYLTMGMTAKKIMMAECSLDVRNNPSWINCPSCIEKQERFCDNRSVLWGILWPGSLSWWLADKLSKLSYDWIKYDQLQAIQDLRFGIRFRRRT